MPKADKIAKHRHRAKQHVQKLVRQRKSFVMGKYEQVGMEELFGVYFLDSVRALSSLGYKWNVQDIHTGETIGSL